MQDNKKKFNSQSGVSLVELMVALGSATFVIISISGLLVSSMRLHKLSNRKMEAVNIASQTMEVSFMLKKKDWESFYSLAGGQYHVAPSNDSWHFVIGPSIEDIYTKNIYIEPVYRDNIGQIALTGNIDPNILKIISTVDWDHYGRTESVELTSYVSK